jgi:hypothetical protein
MTRTCRLPWIPVWVQITDVLDAEVVELEVVSPKDGVDEDDEEFPAAGVLGCVVRIAMPKVPTMIMITTTATLPRVPIPQRREVTPIHSKKGDS